MKLRCMVTCFVGKKLYKQDHVYDLAKKPNEYFKTIGEEEVVKPKKKHLEVADVKV